MTKPAPKKRLIAVTAALGLALSLSACGNDATQKGENETTSNATATEGAVIEVKDAWIKATTESMTGAFATITNTSDTEITVESAASPVAPMVELHEVVEKAGTMVMQPKEGGFAVAGGASYTLQPGGDHIMLMQLTQPIKAGEKVPFTLTLSNGDTVDFEAVAKEFTGAKENYQPSPSGHDMGSMHDMSSDASPTAQR